jgi:hypothetical protein
MRLHNSHGMQHARESEADAVLWHAAHAVTADAISMMLWCHGEVLSARPIYPLIGSPTCSADGITVTC